VKIRLGFVSNSSSAAYIVGAATYRTVFDVVRAMIDLKYWVDEEETDCRYLREQRTAREALLLQLDCAIASGVDPNAPVAIDDITYIYQEQNGNYYLATDYNEPYDDLENASPVLDDNRVGSDTPSDRFFYYLAYGFEGKIYLWNDPDPAHFCDSGHPRCERFLTRDGANICPICDVDRLKPRETWIHVLESRSHDSWYYLMLRHLYSLVGLNPITLADADAIARRLSEAIATQLAQEKGEKTCTSDSDL
jgi:hypothetical protein